MTENIHEHDDPAMLAAGYALGTLTPEELAEYRAYLSSSAAGRADAAAHEATAAALGHDAASVSPPPALKARLMAALANTPQLPAANEPPQPLDEAPRPAETPAESRARARWYTRPTGVAIAAAAAVLLFVGGTVVGSAVTSGESTEQRTQAFSSILDAPDVRTASAQVTGGGTATLVWSAKERKSALLVDGLGALPTGKTYQLWYIRDGVATPAGLMSASPDAAATWRVLDGDLAVGDTVGVTVEPKGGSKQPTTTPLVAIKS